MILHSKARPIISTLTIPSPIKKYFSQASWKIDLSNNTNPYLGDLAQYPDVKQDELKDIYLDKILSLNSYISLGLENRNHLESKNVLFTVGSMEGLDLILRTFSEPNKDSVCLISPTFPAYNHWALLHNLEVIHTPLLGETLNEFSVEAILQCRPKIVFLCDPNNPTGTKVESLLIKNLCDSFDGLIVIDEAYIEFSEHPSHLSYLSHYKNLIILRTFSKAWGLAGIRCGAILADETIINALRYVQLPFGVTSFTQKKVRECLLHCERTVQSWQKIKENRVYLSRELSNMESVSKVYPSQTNFLLVVLKNFEYTMELLKEYGIQVFDCSSVVSDSIRVSLGTEEQNKQFLDVIEKAIL